MKFCFWKLSFILTSSVSFSLSAKFVSSIIDWAYIDFDLPWKEYLAEHFLVDQIRQKGLAENQSRHK